MTKHINHIITLIFIFLGAFNAQAQKVDTIKTPISKDLPAEQVEVIKQFQARLEDARKINIVPEQTASRKLESFDYNVNIRPIQLAYLDPDIKPIAMRSDILPKKYNGYARAGYGNFNAIDAGVGYNYLFDSGSEITIMGNFLRMNNKKESFQKYQNLDTKLGINHIFSPLIALNVNAGYQRKNVFFFGSPIDSIGLDSSLYNRTISKFGFGMKAFNAETNVYNVNYTFGVNYNNVNLVDENLLENNFIVNLNASKTINDHFTIVLNGKVDLTTILDTANFNYNNYFINPGVAFSNEKLNVRASVNFGFTKDKTYYLPDLMLSYSPGDYRIIPYAFWKSEIQKNNIDHLIDVNPFLSTGIVPNIENSIINRYGIGMKGVVNGLSYDGQINFGKTDNLILFNAVLNEQNLRQFEILKDTASILQFKAGADYAVNDHFNINTDLSFNKYTLNENEKPWHLPLYQIDVEVNYFLLENKLKISPKLFLRDGTFVQNEDLSIKELNPLIDFNFMAEYTIKNQFSIYGKVNNILASEYQLWDNYSYYGLNAMFGLKAVF